MTFPANLASLYKREEEIRADSIRQIEKYEKFSDHLAMTHGSMAIVYALAHDHANATDDELTIQYLGLRLFNTAASAMKLSLSGYYQNAFAQMRDIYETVALLDYMSSSPEQIAAWKASDKKQRIAKFGPGAIRDALNERDGLTKKVLQTFLWVGSTLSRMVFKEGMRWRAWNCIGTCLG